MLAYDGDPQFETISGTRLQYAVNASATVLRLDGMYYAVDNGVWFQSNKPNGPWQVSTTRPEDVDRIPPSYPVYNSNMCMYMMQHLIMCTPVIHPVT